MQKAMAGVSILSPEAEAAVERLLTPCKFDLLYNPTRFVGWEQLAMSYHEAADWVLVGGPALFFLSMSLPSWL